MEELPFFPPAILEEGGNFALIEHAHNDVCCSVVVVPMALAVLIMSLVIWSDILGAWWLMALPNSQAGVLKTIESRNSPLFHHQYPGTSVSCGPTFALYEDDTCRDPIMAPLAETELTINRVSSVQLLGASWHTEHVNSKARMKKKHLVRVNGLSDFDPYPEVPLHGRRSSVLFVDKSKCTGTSPLKCMWHWNCWL